MMMECEMEAWISPNGDMSSIDLGYGSFGCSHYRRRCKIRAPCCNEIFDCRHCHNEAKNSLGVDPLLRHDIPRHDMEKVICSLCGTEQDVRQYCIQCEVCMGKYFCAKCKFFDDDVSKKQYHCNECVLVPKDFFLSRFAELEVRTTFSTAKSVIHMPCLLKILLRYVERVGETRSRGSNPYKPTKVASTPMPQMYQHKMVWILCNDCSEISEVNYHIVAHKCLKCKSYNTRLTQGGPSSCSPRIAQIVR
uniref:E3 ubiquitin-protein ligase MIEL1-like n=1 Tax=Cucumis melo TaxID=3656 RepID=A0A9I9DVM8_CUCME